MATTEETIYILDMDGTIIDSAEALIHAQSEGLERLANQSKRKDEFLDELKSGKSLKNIVTDLTPNNVDSPINNFFNNFYQTPNVELAFQNGQYKLFEDFDEWNKQTSGKKILISNSTKTATQAKANLYDLNFDGVHGEFEEGKSKPSIYMGIKALAELTKKYPSLQLSKLKIINIGDNETDMEFGSNIREFFTNYEIENILVNRKGNTNSKYADRIIESFEEL
ncbi:HAD family hydrolase [Candidatus Woesearchaeota archaeon]|jgi:phosphoglycolate phosphatase-like HAD superfamily hydrolase|nr:HAD family hydrolase [Candidatus Woesearchaeota archaeon]MBT4387945.1 HAD family hydrolase [Candidatus Woesearchaeota archaeon]MBT4595763.1 HAD family hydrolase [Candidatus Woesearchaeota archaeon]MBT5741388.1 HAD family hydrolase [Candidatus Woesearchaeota archaeon]MBT6505210.1 HAD family hydrolase [Candidatus Woesearchaeota archaeon]